MIKQNKKKYFVVGDEKNKALFKNGSTLDLHHRWKSGTMIYGERFTIELPCNYMLVEHYKHVNCVHGKDGEKKYPEYYMSDNEAHDIVLEYLENNLEAIRSDFKLNYRLGSVLDKLKAEKSV